MCFDDTQHHIRDAGSDLHEVQATLQRSLIAIETRLCTRVTQALVTFIKILTHKIGEVLSCLC